MLSASHVDLVRAGVPLSLPRSLPRHRSDAWAGGFVLDRPIYTGSISASGGTVVAATTERMYRIRPGATRFQWRDIPDDHGDVVCVAVEPRRPGRTARFAHATFPRTLHLEDDEGDTPIDLPDEYEEIHDLMWAPRANGGDPTMCLHVWLGDRVIRLLPGDGPGYAFEANFWPVDGDVRAMASDGNRGVAFAVLDEETGELDVWVLDDLETNLWVRRSIPTPSFFSGARLAVAGKAVAVTFDHTGGVWMTRNVKEQPFVEIDQLPGGKSDEDGQTGRGDVVLAFGGASEDSALFAAMQETVHRWVVARIDAAGRHERILELTVESDDAPARGASIEAMVWDETRRTLWCAAGQAGILCSTEPGSPAPLGEKGALRAPS